MDASKPDPDAVRATIERSPVHEALQTLDDVFDRYDETETVEIAETTYADLACGVETLYRLDCYVAHDLERYKRTLPGTLFSTLPADYDAYDLTHGDATLHLTFGETHGSVEPVGLPYRALTVAIPHTDAYFRAFYEAVRDRQE